MTEEQIIEAAGICKTGKCPGCPHRELYSASCIDKLMEDVFALINRQKAEIERVEKEAKDKERAYNDEFCLRKEWQTKCRELLKDKQTTKFEAIKEFAERVKEKLQWDVEFDNKLVFESDIDNLVKEMTEVQK